MLFKIFQSLHEQNKHHLLLMQTYTNNSVGELTNGIWWLLYVLIMQKDFTLKFTILNFHSFKKSYQHKHKDKGPLGKKPKSHFINCNWNREKKIKTKLSDQCCNKLPVKTFYWWHLKNKLLKILQMNSMLQLPIFPYGQTIN